MSIKVTLLLVLILGGGLVVMYLLHYAAGRFQAFRPACGRLVWLTRATGRHSGYVGVLIKIVGGLAMACFRAAKVRSTRERTLERAAWTRARFKIQRASTSFCRSLAGVST